MFPAFPPEPARSRRTLAAADDSATFPARLRTAHVTAATAAADLPSRQHAWPSVLVALTCSSCPPRLLTAPAVTAAVRRRCVGSHRIVPSTTQASRIDFTPITDPGQRRTAKELLQLQDRPGGPGRRESQAHEDHVSLGEFREVRAILADFAQQEVSRLADVTPALLAGVYAGHAPPPWSLPREKPGWSCTWPRPGRPPRQANIHAMTRPHCGPVAGRLSPQENTASPNP